MSLSSIGVVEFNKHKGLHASYDVFPREVRGLYYIQYGGKKIDLSLVACRDNGWTLKTNNRSLQEDWERGGPKPMAKGVSNRKVSPQKRWENIYGKPQSSFAQ